MVVVRICVGRASCELQEPPHQPKKWYNNILDHAPKPVKRKVDSECEGQPSPLRRERLVTQNFMLHELRMQSFHALQTMDVPEQPNAACLVKPPARKIGLHARRHAHTIGLRVRRNGI